jgi:hypothetical protein
MVAAPLRLGHRSFTGDKAERRRLQVHGDTAIQGTRERARMLRRINNSP